MINSDLFLLLQHTQTGNDGDECYGGELAHTTIAAEEEEEEERRR